MGLGNVNSNLVASEALMVRGIVSDIRVSHMGEHNDGIILEWDHAPSPPRNAVTPLPISINLCDLGLTIKTHSNHKPAHLQAQSSGLDYYFTEPESPKGDLVCHKPNPSSLNSDSTEILSPISSPISTKQNAL